VGALALGEAREVDHQRGVREAQLGEVDDDVASGPQGGRKRPTTTTAGGAVLIPGDAQDPELCVE
jgi:hypothetical protein